MESNLFLDLINVRYFSETQNQNEDLQLVNYKSHLAYLLDSI